MVRRMTAEREGYRYFGAHLADAVWEALLADAERSGESVTKQLNEVLRAYYKIPAAEMPRPKRVGRKPKKK